MNKLVLVIDADNTRVKMALYSEGEEIDYLAMEEFSIGQYLQWIGDRNPDYKLLSSVRK